jgi:hypothetical protein
VSRVSTGVASPQAALFPQRSEFDFFHSAADFLTFDPQARQWIIAEKPTFGVRTRTGSVRFPELAWRQEGRKPGQSFRAG